MRGLVAGLAVAALGCTASAVAAQSSRARIAFDRSETQVSETSGAAAAELQVTSPAFAEGGAIPKIYSAYGKNISPPVAWSAGPVATQSYVLVLEDADSASQPAVHWLAYDIPKLVLSLSRGAKNTAEPSSPVGMLQGPNNHDSFGYTGPRPGVGEPAHHYHLQLFALDRRLRLRPGAPLQLVIGAMRGHVIARGQLVGLYSETAPKPRQSQSVSPSPP